MSTKEAVNHPPHYQGRMECIQLIEEVCAGKSAIEAFCIGNIVKYIYRYDQKGAPLQDLQKARWYLDFLISKYDK